MSIDYNELTHEITITPRVAWNGWSNNGIQIGDELLLQKGGSQQKCYQVIDELERDTKVSECLNKRSLSLLSHEWVVTPASQSRKDKTAADLVRDTFERISYDRLSGHLHDAIMKGVAFVEPVWQIQSSGVELNDVIHVEPWLFNFIPSPEKDDLIYNRFGVRLADMTNPQPGEKIPPKKILVHRVGARYSNPWGTGLGGKLFWPVYFKRQGIQFWLAFAERFGTPVPWGRYPVNATPEQRATLKRALSAFSQEGAIMTPQGMEVELIEATRHGIDTYEKLCNYFDAAISGVLLGKAGGKDSGGQLATQIAVENDVRLEQVKGDADLIDATVNAQLVRWIVDLNLPGAAYPKVKRVIEEPSDLKATAESVKILSDAGWHAPEQYIEDKFGAGWTRVTKAPNTSSDQGAQFAADVEQSPAGLRAVDEAANNLADEQSDEISAGLINDVLEALKNADSFEAMLTILESAAEQQNLQPLTEALARAGFSAFWLGQADGDES